MRRSILEHLVSNVASPVCMTKELTTAVPLAMKTKERTTIVPTIVPPDGKTSIVGAKDAALRRSLAESVEVQAQ